MYIVGILLASIKYVFRATTSVLSSKANNITTCILKLSAIYLVHRPTVPLYTEGAVNVFVGISIKMRIICAQHS